MSFDEAINLVLVTGNNKTEDEMFDRINVFDGEANGHPVIHELVVLACTAVCEAANAGSLMETQAAIGSTLYSMFMHGLAVGREMERCDIELIAAAKL